MTEAQLSKKMVKAIRDRGGWAQKTHGGVHMRDWPDIVGCHRGWFLGLEVKLPGKEGTLTDGQAHTLLKIKEAEGESHMVTSVKEVIAILDDIDRMEELAA